MGSTTFRQLLAGFEAAATSTAVKGRLFEEFSQAFFRTDPLWQDRFEQVWLWQDWPGRDGETDSGVDLVAKQRGGGLVAIQCKFYAASATIGQGHLGKFLSVLGRDDFVSGLFVSTTSKPWSPKARDQIRLFGKPVQVFGMGDFEESAVDWSRYQLERPAELSLQVPKELRPHQKEAIDRTVEGFEENSRGQLIMACGTGKTFTSLKLAERLVGVGGTVLFLVPSINLLSQSVKAWAADASIPLDMFAVCSDTRAGKRTADEDATPNDLVFPASTDAIALEREYSEKRRSNAMAVIFSTYQSIDVVGEFQRAALEPFDLLIADEAHRTTGVILASGGTSVFTRVHEDAHVAARRRVYMTATPRVYAERTKAKAQEHSAFLATMDDEATFGPVFHKLKFGDAVAAGLLTDYKVLVLAVDEGEVSRSFQRQLADDGIELNLDDAAKMIGCWHALSKRGPQFGEDNLPMQRAVSFTSTIKESEKFASVFPTLVDDALEEWSAQNAVRIEADHVDGKTNVQVRSERIAWLEEDPGRAVCRVLSNAKCLTEGVDVPALDAILFLKPRRSIVDVVQAVGRVMRLAPGKDCGYVILPIAVPAGMSPEEALRDNKRYEVVWEVLQALRSHDERLNAEINKIDINGRSDKVDVIGIGLGGGKGVDGDSANNGRVDTVADDSNPTQLVLPAIGEWRDALYARIVEKVGDRHYWDKWAKDIGSIAQRHETRIRGILERDDLNSEIAVEFEAFHSALRAHLNDSIDRDGAISMLSQHLITRPVFNALFGEDTFVNSNPVSKVMQRMAERLDERRVDREGEQEQLKKFYQSVKLRAEGIDNAAGKQKIIAELYEQFFKNAIPKVAESLGIVYTPVEVVDFIHRSVDELLHQHFDGVRLRDDGVHVLDPFVGTGTFITRLMQARDLIPLNRLPHKYQYELHANELMLLAYYVAAINIETTYHDLVAAEAYNQFEGIVLTDTFQMSEEGDAIDAVVFPYNNRRADRQKGLDIRVIVGNPPYSVGQGSQNDDNQNLRYPTLDNQIGVTYAAQSSAQSKISLYDSYVRALRWSSSRVLESAHGGIVAMVTNGGWLDGNTADGIRRSFADEFHHVYVYNLRGNQRTSGDQSRKEGGKIFGQGSRATVAITLLVKQPTAVPTEGAMIHYHDIGDYLSRDEKLARVADASIGTLNWRRIVPNEQADWLEQRSTTYAGLVPLADSDDAVFDTQSRGLLTARDVWVVNSSHAQLVKNVERMVAFYNAQLGEFEAVVEEGVRGKARLAKVKEVVDRNPEKFSWNSRDFDRIAAGKSHTFDESMVRVGLYRPFFKQRVVMHQSLNDRTYRLPSLFPESDSFNTSICILQTGTVAFSVLASNSIADVCLFGAGNPMAQFARWKYPANNKNDLFASPERISNISSSALDRFRSKCGSEIDDDALFAYTYGILHSPEYRREFAINLKKEAPRIPLPQDRESFDAFAAAGERLLDLHINYESVNPYALEEIWRDDAPTDDYARFQIEKLEYAKCSVDGKRALDRTQLICNPFLTLSGIPERAHDYMIGTRSGIDWLVDRYKITTNKASGIVNDPNLWVLERDDPRYIVDLVKRIVTVSLGTLDVVDALPELAFD